MKSRLPSGFSNGNNSVNNMIKQAQKMQNEISKIQEDLASTEFKGTAGGGAVTITVYGNKTVKSVSLNPDVVDPNDVEMLEDLIIAAFNQAIQTAEEELNSKMNSVTGGISIPGLI